MVQETPSSPPHILPGRRLPPVSLMHVQQHPQLIMQDGQCLS